MSMRYIKTTSLPRMDDPVLNRALEQLDEELNRIARVFIDWTASVTQDIHDDNIPSSAVTQHEADIDHNALTNFEATKHFLQSAITKVGTIATGVWQGTAIANTYVAGLDQNCLQASSPIFVTAKLSGLTDGYVPYHVADATGLADSPLFTDGTMVFIGDTANTKMTQGLTINQAGNDDEILTFKSSDVAHGCTTYTETDTYGYVSKLNGNEGGLFTVGLSEATDALVYQALYTTDNTLKDADALAPVRYEIQKISGTGRTNMGANANAFVIRVRRDGSTVAVFIVDEDGDILYDGTSNPYQNYDDIALLQDLEDSLSGKITKTKIKGKDIYKKHKIIYGDNFVSTKRKNMLVYGAIRQLNEKIEALEARFNN